MNDNKMQSLADSIDLKKCVFCGEVMLMKGVILGIKGLPETNPNSKEVDMQNADLVVPVTCPHCGFVHLFSGQTLSIPSRSDGAAAS
jgi:hypothetical protein